MIRAILGGLLVWQGSWHWYLAIAGVALWFWSLRADRMRVRMWRTVCYGAAMYAPLVLLGAGTAMRIVSDAAMLLDRRRDAGLLQALAIVSLMLLSARAFLRGRRDA